MGMELDGKIAIVTGAGSGIGRAAALTLAKAGAWVVVNDIIGERAHETVAMIDAAGGTARAVTADVTDPVAVDHFVQATMLEWGQIDILCNNAGILDRMEPAAETSLELWDRVMAVNTTGPFLMARAVLPHMLAKGKGAIVNTASEAGFRGGGAGLAYTVSKHGIVGLTRSIAWMHAEEGIRCNAICPGPTITNIAGDGGLEQFDSRFIARLTPVQGLMPRAAAAQRQADAILFLASDQSSYINGAILPVDGGWSAG